MLAACARRRARDRRLVPAGLDPCPRAGRGADPQPLLSDRSVRRHRRELRQDPHVRRPTGGRRELPRILDLPAGRAGGAGRDAVGRARHDDLLRPALPLSLSRAGACRRHDAGHPVLVHRADRAGALAHAAARPRHRDRLLRLRAGAGRHAQGLQRKTYGHSIAVAPWGEVLADAGGEKAGFVVAEIDLGKVAEARKMVPSLGHDRNYAAPVLHKAALARAAE